MNKHNLISKLQSGFRSRNSTQAALLQLTSGVSRFINKKSLDGLRHSGLEFFVRNEREPEL